MSSKYFKRSIFSLLFISALLFQTVQKATAVSGTPTTDDAVKAAWDKAKAADRYTYTSTIEQTAYPAARISSVGKAPQVDSFFVDGQFNQADEQLRLTLQESTSQETSEIWVDGNTAKGRRIDPNTTEESEWKELGNVSEFFAPGGDPLGFLAGATNIQFVENSSPTLDSSLLSLYSFSFSGQNFGLFITNELEKQLKENGQLMPEATLQVSDVYKQMAGTGQIWIDEAEYPARIRLDLNLGTQPTGERVTAQIGINYSDFSTPASTIGFW